MIIFGHIITKTAKYRPRAKSESDVAAVKTFNHAFSHLFGRIIYVVAMNTGSVNMETDGLDPIGIPSRPDGTGVIGKNIKLRIAGQIH